MSIYLQEHTKEVGAKKIICRVVLGLLVVTGASAILHNCAAVFNASYSPLAERTLAIPHMTI